MRKIIILLAGIFSVAAANAQELNARVTVSAKQVGSNVNKNTFMTLQTALYNFMNNKKWSKDV